MKWLTLALCIGLTFQSASAADLTPLNEMDVFHLEFAADPQISPDGERIVYVQRFADINKTL